MKLSTFEPAVRPTIQGDGVLLGMPMTFVRMWGCDFSCSWCDTKESWRPGSVSEEIPVEQIAADIKKHKIPWVSITGGNPLVQPEELIKLMDLLDGFQILVESQASIYNEGVFRHRNLKLVSLSPKLHDWRWDTLQLILESARADGRKVQLKVVVTSEADTYNTLDYFRRLNQHFHRYSDELFTYILLPEYSLGRQNTKATHKVLTDFQARIPMAEQFPVRIIPQIHKLALFVP